MKISYLHPCLLQIIRQILCHLFRKRSDKNTLMNSSALLNLYKEVINLSLQRTHLDYRVKKPCRSNNLLYNLLCTLHLISRRRRRNVHYLIYTLFKLLKRQRPVIKCRRQTEAVIHQRLLTRAVSRVHCTKLRHGYMRLVHNNQKVLRKIIQKRIRSIPRFSVRKMP